MFRTSAIREVIPTYSTNVNRAFEFLTKDMGRYHILNVSVKRIGVSGGRLLLLGPLYIYNFGLL